MDRPSQFAVTWRTRRHVAAGQEWAHRMGNSQLVAVTANSTATMSSMTDQPEGRLPDLAVEVAWVRRLAVAVAADAHVGEEIAQEALLAASRGGNRSRHSFRAWIAGAVRNLHLHRVRSDAERVAREQLAAHPERVEDSTLALERLECVELLSRAVRELPEPYRTSVLLRWYEALTPEEIARRTNTPVRTVHSRLNRALALLREALDRRTRGDRSAWLSAWIPVLPDSTKVVPWVLIMDLKLKLAIAAACVVALLSLGYVLAPLAKREGTQERGVPAVASGRTDSSRATDPVRGGPESAFGDREALAAAAKQVAPAEPPAMAARGLRILVHDAQGIPIAGVSLAGMLGGLLGTTSTDGSCNVPYGSRLELSRNFPLFAERDGYVSKCIALPEPGTSELSVELATLVPNVFVTVLNSARVPQPGACVVLTTGPRPFLSPLQSFELGALSSGHISLLGAQSWMKYFSSTTDESGRASFCVPQKTYLLIAHAPGQVLFEGSLEVPPTSAAPIRTTITLPSGRELRGRVLEQQTRAPVEGARVWFSASGSEPVVTDERGEFRAMVAESPDAQSVCIYHPEFSPLVGEQSGFAEFELKRGAVARVRLVDEAQQPISEPVLLQGLPLPNRPFSNAGFAYYRTVTPDAQGNLDVKGIERALLESFTLLAPEFEQVSVSVDPQSPTFSGTRTVITLHRRSVCRVALVDSMGRPVRGASLSYTTKYVVAGLQRRHSDQPLVEDEPGVYLLESSMAGADVAVEVTASEEKRFVAKVIKEPGAPFPSDASLTLPEK